MPQHYAKSLPQLRQRMSEIIDNHHNAQQDLLETFVDRGRRFDVGNGAAAYTCLEGVMAEFSLRLSEPARRRLGRAAFAGKSPEYP